MAQNNWNQNQQILNYFWSRIGFEQNTNRLIIHNGYMRNLTYMDGWQVLNQNGGTYLYDSNTQRLFDRQLNYYYQGNYYDMKGNLLRDYVSESVIDTTAKEVKEAIKKDPIFGANGNGNKNIYSATPNIKKQYSATSTPYVIDNNARFKEKQELKPKQNKVLNEKSQNKSVKSKAEPNQNYFTNKQQDDVDKIVAEQLSKQKENNVNQLQKRQLVQKKLNGPTTQERLNTGQTKMNEKIDIKGHGKMSMTQRADEYFKMKAASMNKQTTKSSSFKPRGQTFNKGPDSATVGKIITGVIDGSAHEFAAKIAADFSSYKYGKILSKLF